MNMKDLEKILKNMVKEKQIRDDYGLIKDCYDEMLGNQSYKDIYQYLFDNPGKREVLLGFKDSYYTSNDLEVRFDGEKVRIYGEYEQKELELDVNFPSGELIVSDGSTFFMYNPEALNVGLKSDQVKISEILADQGMLYTFVGATYPKVFKKDGENLEIGHYFETLKEAEDSLYGDKTIKPNQIKDKIECLVSTGNRWISIIDKQLYIELMEKNLNIDKLKAIEILNNNIKEGEWNIVKVNPGKYKYTNNYMLEGENNIDYLKLQKIGEVTYPLVKKYKSDYINKTTIMSEYLSTRYDSLYPVFFKFIKNKVFSYDYKEDYLNLSKNNSDLKKISEFTRVDNDIKDFIKEIPVFDYNVMLREKYSQSDTFIYKQDSNNQYAIPRKFELDTFLKCISIEDPVEVAFYGLVYLKTILENSKKTLFFTEERELQATKQDIAKGMVVLCNIIKKEDGFHYAAMLKNSFLNNYEIVNHIHPKIIEKEMKYVESYKPFLDEQGISVKDAIGKNIRDYYGSDVKFSEVLNKKKNLKI